MKTTARIAAAALLALTTAPVFAGAANAGPAHMRLSDLDLSRAEHVQTFNTRVSAVQRRLCGQVKRSLTDRAACRSAVLEEIVGHLSSQQRLALTAEPSSRG